LEASTLRGLPALVVDDNATNRRILEVELAGWGMKPSTAASAAEALNAIRKAAASGAPFRLALVDFHMPDVDGLELTGQIRRMPEAADVKVIMMSSAVRENYSLEDRGIDAYLLKPVNASELFGVIRTVLGKASLSQNGSKRPRTARSAHPVRILVAEDSPVNQELIKRLLTKWGHSVVIAHNGKQALSLLEVEKFDVVLMDLQMPEINGFEATATIREEERATGTHVPIIALTAHALKGDRERCIAAGMDEYVAKPIDAQKLFEVIESATAGVVKAGNNGRSHAPMFDADELLKNFDSDVELVRKLVDVFADSSGVQLSEIREAIAHGDSETVEFASHSLKGAVANFRARAAVDAAARDAAKTCRMPMPTFTSWRQKSNDSNRS
jgi:CheY-like chemotaxis protein